MVLEGCLLELGIKGAISEELIEFYHHSEVSILTPEEDNLE